MKRKRNGGGDAATNGEFSGGGHGNGSGSSNNGILKGASTAHPEKDTYALSMEQCTQEGMHTTRLLHTHLKEASVHFGDMSEEDRALQIKALRSLTKQANNLFLKMKRLVYIASEARRVELSVQMEEMRAEIVDRDANASRLQDRVRLFTDKANGAEQIPQRAITAAAQISESVRQLCPWQLRATKSVEHIHALQTNQVAQINREAMKVADANVGTCCIGINSDASVATGVANAVVTN